MATRIFFRDNEILIDTIPTPFVAASLTATLNGAQVDITRFGSDFVFASPLWSDVANADGDTLASPDAVMAYLSAQFAMRRAVGEIFAVSTVAGADLIRGQPLTVSRANGQLLPARSDTYALSFVAGLAPTDVAAGFADQPIHGAVTLPDWTALSGAATLASGLPYFLGLAGGFSVVPPNVPGQCVTRIGYAATPTTLIVAPTDPIQL